MPCVWVAHTTFHLAQIQAVAHVCRYYAAVFSGTAWALVQSAGHISDTWSGDCRRHLVLSVQGLNLSAAQQIAHFGICCWMLTLVFASLVLVREDSCVCVVLQKDTQHHIILSCVRGYVSECVCMHVCMSVRPSVCLSLCLESPPQEIQRVGVNGGQLYSICSGYRRLFLY